MYEIEFYPELKLGFFKDRFGRHISLFHKDDKSAIVHFNLSDKEYSPYLRFYRAPLKRVYEFKGDKAKKWRKNTEYLFERLNSNPYVLYNLGKRIGYLAKGRRIDKFPEFDSKETFYQIFGVGPEYDEPQTSEEFQMFEYLKRKAKVIKLLRHYGIKFEEVIDYTNNTGLRVKI